MGDPILGRIAAAHACSAAAVALAWIIRSGNVIVIPQSGSVAHVKENSVALSLILTPEDIQTLEAAFPMSLKDKLRVLVDRTRLRAVVDPTRRWLRPLLERLAITSQTERN